MRFLTAENTGDGAYAGFAIYNQGTSPRIIHVSAIAFGNSFSVGIYNSSASPLLMHVTAQAAGGNAIHNYVSSPTLIDVVATSTGGTYNYGVLNLLGSPKLYNVIATGEFCGISNSDNSPELNHVVAYGDYGICNSDASPSIRNSVIQGSVGGIHNSAVVGSYPVIQVDNCQIIGPDYTIFNINSQPHTYIGASKMQGGDIYLPAAVSCAGVYDENYDFYANTCP